MRHATFVLLLLMLVACSGVPRGVDPASRRITPPAEVAVPPGIEAAALTPLPSDALTRARTTSDAVFAQLATLPELQAADTADAPQLEPPLAAQRAYIDGRTAMREGRRDDAIAQLEQVLRLAPRSAAAMRLLGQVYATANDPIRAAQYFTDAVRADPTHASSLFVLGRFALERGDWARASALIRAAVERSHAGAQRDAAMEQLGRYYLGVALARLGYHRAAVEQYEAFVIDDAPIAGTQAVVRELAMLREQDRLTWQTLGDLHHQLNQPAEAQRAYEAAANSPRRGVVFDLAPRRVYTHLRLGEADAALDLVLTQVRDTRGSEASLQLVRYLASQGVGVRPLADELARIAQQDDAANGSALTIALADLYAEDEAQRVMLDHLAQHPDDVRVFQRLLDDWLDAPAEAIARTADLMDRYPLHAELYGLTLLNAADDAPSFAAAFEKLPGTQRDRAMVRILEGLALANLARVDEAEAAFAAALARDDGSRVARLQLAKVKVARGRFDEAATLLEPLGPSKDASVVALRVRVLMETGDPAAALALLDRMIEAGDADPALILQKARLQIALGDAAAAERTLTDALNLDPTREAYYEALFQMYDAQDTSGRPLVRDGDVQYRRLMRRMLGLIPDSRIGKIKRAELHALATPREYGQAIALLLSLVEQDHRDLAALRQLLGVLVEADRTPQAVELMEKRLELFGRDPQMLQLAAGFFEQVGDVERMAAVQEQLLAMLPDGDEKLFATAALYLRSNRAAQAADLLAAALDEAAANDSSRLMLLLAATRMQLNQPQLIDADFNKAFDRFPGDAADLHYRWAMTHTMRGDEAGYQCTLELTREKFPDHGPTNNDLGYLWTEQHKNLEQALRMIQSAVDSEPENAAYLDSLGWVHYKLGRYDDAVVWLRKSEAQTNADASRGDADALTTQVVVMDHLGDALYRQGDRAEANRVWRRAQRVLSNLAVGSSAELVKVRESLANKTNAVRNQAPVPVAEVPGQPAPPPDAAPQPAAPMRDEA